jgi:hypothetical protein
MQKSVRYAQTVALGSSKQLLRRQPPRTLSPEVQPYPKDLISL